MLRLFGRFAEVCLNQAHGYLTACNLQVVTAGQRQQDFRLFLDQHQYTQRGIQRYERIFGSGFISTGGLQTTQVCLSLPTSLSLLPSLDDNTEDFTAHLRPFAVSSTPFMNNTLTAFQVAN